MSREAQVRVGLTVRVGSLDYTSKPTGFSADVSVAGGPGPGAISVSTGGTDVDLSQFITPGFCWVQNLDSTNYVEYGIWDAGTTTFYPLGEMLPGECYVLRLSRNIQEAYAGTGTGTTAEVNRLRFKANGAACKVRIDIFEK